MRLVVRWRPLVGWAVAALCIARSSQAQETTVEPSPLKLSLFVDSYAAWQTAAPGTLATLSAHRAFSGQSATLRAENGISLAFMGVDVAYDAGTFGALVNVRLGQAASLYHYHAQPESDATFGVDHLTQAYLFVRPIKELELDLGMYTSPFGFESLESWKNPNYTISALYVYGQPSWHTGLKAKWQALETLSVMAMICDGVNNISEVQQGSGLNQTPSLGASLNFVPTPVLSLSLGGLWASNAKDNDDGGIDGFVDFVSTVTLGRWSTSLNADFIVTRNGAPSGADRHFWGASLTNAYRFTEAVGVAARGEYLRDDANYGGGDVWQLTTGTLTLDLRPIPHVRNLVVRWENRWEHSNQPIFGLDSRGTPETADDRYGRKWFETVLGVVVTTAP
ncbi:MAG: outer membrane beta-barrel protein [Polyangiaceae bacterium]